MKNIEKLIKNNGREQLYNYYLSLGYNHKTAASLNIPRSGYHQSATGYRQ